MGKLANLQNALDKTRAPIANDEQQIALREPAKPQSAARQANRVGRVLSSAFCKFASLPIV